MRLVGDMWTTCSIPHGNDGTPGRPVSIVVFSDVRFIREALVEIFQRSGRFDAHGIAESSALEQSLARHVDIILIDAHLPDGVAAVRRIKRDAPQIRVVAFALAEDEKEVIAWAESGVSGYIPRSTALSDMVTFLEAAIRGEQICSPRVASGLVRRLAVGSAPERSDHVVTLTRRELEIVQLINDGLSNKEIARRLKIGLATAKSHVHNVLEKLGVERRSQAAQWMRERTGTASG
jgi:DNA-binding NarL/FixJ family response regulator